MNIQFRLKDGKPNKDGTKLIVLVMTFEQKRIRSGTKISIKPEYWDNSLKDNRGGIIKKHPQSLSLNTVLDKLANDFTTAYNILRAQGKPCTSETILGFIRHESSSKKHDFIKSLDEFIHTQRTLQELSEERIKHYDTLRAYLIEFSEAYNYKLTFDRINTEFFEKFVSFMIQIKDIVNNSAALKVKALKRFMKDARERGWHNTSDYEKFAIKQYEPETFALTSEELRLIEALNLEGKPNLLRYAKDFFLFECYTGLRFNEIMKLTQENVRDNSIYLRISKTKEPHRVPLFGESRNLLGKLLQEKGEMMRIENALMNKNIKKVCELAGLTESRSITQMQGNQRITVTKPFYKFISTHTARRTCITYLYNKGFGIEEIAHITRQTPEIVRQYVKLSPHQTEDKFRAIMTERLSKHQI